MGQTTIEWTRPMRPDGTLMPGYTANLWWGCTHVHDGCDHCYAEAFAKRYQPTALWGKGSPRMAIDSVWNNLLKYQRIAKAAGEIHLVFVGSMMDIAERPMPIINREGIHAVDTSDGSFIETDYLRDRFCNEIVPLCPNLMFLLLTKRPGNFNRYMPKSWRENPPANVMFGTSIVQRSQLKTLLKQLKQVNGRRFLSLEPQLENIPNIDLDGIHWVIQGGESGPHRRPFDTDWARAMKYQCELQNVPYFFKQIDKIQPIPDDLLVRQFPQ